MEERETKLQTEKEKIHEELSAKTKEIERYGFINSKSTLHIFPICITHPQRSDINNLDDN